MRLRMPKSRVWSGLVVCAAVLGLTSFGPVHAADKVDICHFQPEQGSWKLLSVGQPAAEAHLRNHDDALPGGTTSQTGTVLDAECVEVVVTCPCEGLENPPAVWGDDFPTGECLLVNNGTLFVLTNQVSNADGTLNVFSSGECILFRGPANPQVRIDGLTSLEVAACEASLRRIAFNDGVTCPQEGL
jgi:hypothetical protein